MDVNVKECMDFVLPLVKECGNVMLTASDYRYRVKEETQDVVTIYDNQIEEVFMRKLKEKFPTHKFIGEEDSDRKGIAELTNDPTWIIDPIDGTSNFIKRLRLSGISVGLVVNKEQIMGIVYNPYTDELYTAIKGEGAYLNGERIHTTDIKEMSKAIFGYELSLGTDPRYYDLYMYRMKHLMKTLFGIRSFGSAVVSLCYVADGRLDAYQCDGLFPWDAAAGVLIVREAGGHVCDTSGKDFDLMKPNFLVAATKELSDELLAVEKVADEERLRDGK